MELFDPQSVSDSYLDNSPQEYKISPDKNKTLVDISEKEYFLGTDKFLLVVNEGDSIIPL